MVFTISRLNGLDVTENEICETFASELKRRKTEYSQEDDLIELWNFQQEASNELKKSNSLLCNLCKAYYMIIQSREQLRILWFINF